MAAKKDHVYFWKFTGVVAIDGDRTLVSVEESDGRQSRILIEGLTWGTLADEVNRTRPREVY